MSTKLYVMIRGRTKGPFTPEKLRQLAEQHQLSKMHQVSADQMTWVPAGEYEDGLLWKWEEEVEEEVEVITEDLPAPPPESEWYYTSNGVQLGPIGLSELKNLFGCGELGPNEQVWTEAMGEHWKAAGEVPEFMPFFKATVGDPPSEDEGPPITVKTIAGDLSQELPKQPANKRKLEFSGEICKIANKSRGWLIFISIVCFLGSAAFLIQGITDLVKGIKHDLDLIIAAGIGGIINCGIWVTGGLFLLLYSNKMATFKNKRGEAQLKTALSALNRLWLFISIVLIVSIAAGLLMGIIVGLKLHSQARLIQTLKGILR